MNNLPFSPGKKYIAGHFKCQTCDHESVIFIEEDYSLINIMEVDKFCEGCKEYKKTVTDGDVIYRYDYPEADNPPWQLQCAWIEDENRTCEDCYELSLDDDWKKLVVGCPCCEGKMKAK